MGGRLINQVPVVDAIVAPKGEIEEGLAMLRRRALRAGLEIHDARRPYPDFVIRAFEQSLDLTEGHIDELLRCSEDPAEARAQNLVPGGVAVVRIRLQATGHT